MMEAFERLLQPLWAAVGRIAVRGVMRIIDASGEVALMQVQVRENLVLEDVPMLEQYGRASVPHDDSEVLVLAVGGDRSHCVGLMVGGSKHRPKNLKKGEQALYDDQGQLFGVLRDCVLLKTPHKFRIEGDVEIDGNVTISGTSEAADHISDGKSGKSHTHTDSVSGQTTEPL